MLSQEEINQNIQNDEKIIEHFEFNVDCKNCAISYAEKQQLMSKFEEVIKKSGMAFA